MFNFLSAIFFTTFFSKSHTSNANEPPHDKTNKMSVRRAKTQISLGILPVWSESSIVLNR